jgi:two-component system NtrC family sensor kinase
VLDARTAGEGLSLLQKHPDVKLLFTDVVLPGGMNGRQLSDEVAKLHPHIKVLFATGYTRNAIVHHGRLDPGVDVLFKPYNVETLARKVRSILDSAASPDERAPRRSSV